MRIRSILILLAILLVLFGYFYFSNTPEPIEKPEPKYYVWDVDLEIIKRIELLLPREGLSQAFLRSSERDKFPWYFDDQEMTPVDPIRWGGGIPLLLSGPGVDRIIKRDATLEKLAEFGLDIPLLEINLTLEENDSTRIMNIKVGNSVPDGHAFYVQAPSTNDVALVDYTWYEVLKRLVDEPPYIVPEEE